LKAYNLAPWGEDVTPSNIQQNAKFAFCEHKIFDFVVPRICPILCEPKTSPFMARIGEHIQKGKFLLLLIFLG
jgi:hypothetical protein